MTTILTSTLLLTLYFITPVSLSNKTTQFKFPKDFKWCVATSAHQIEGNNTDSDWWQWEHQTPSKIKNNDKSGKACDHWNKLQEDTQILSTMGVDWYRFSIEWAKIEPEEGQWNNNAIEHYHREIKLLLEANITPIVTLQHFTLPNWLAEKGGWSSKDSVHYFEKFVTHIATKLGKHINYWITLNEPLLVIAGGYIKGIMPPGKDNLTNMINPIRHMLLAHAASYNIIHAITKKNKQEAQVGIANHIMIYEPNHYLNPFDQIMTWTIDKALNWTFLNAILNGRYELYFPFVININETMADIKGTHDFIGLNYYSREYIKFVFKEPFIERMTKSSSLGVSDMNQEIYPEGLFLSLEKIKKMFPNLPVIITENGISDKSDSKRPLFIKTHLQQVHKAISKGIDVRGYCHWSIMDNFEWMEGFDQRFGLYEVNYHNMKRTPRQSAHLYTDIIRKNSFKL